MLQKILQALDRERAKHDKQVTITHRNVAYEAGRRIGVIQGLDYAREAIVAALQDLNKKDNDL